MKRIKTNFSNFITESMSGELHFTEDGWMVKDKDGKNLPLHPDDVEQIDNWKLVFDDIESRIKADPSVEYDEISVQKMSGLSRYAKLKNI